LLDNQPRIAMVGSRSASWQGLHYAEEIAAQVAALGLVIVSGLARGIDAACHRGALSVGGATIAVLGQGCDVIYPKENAALHHQIALKGLLVSEYAPGTQPRGYHFPARNRVITGLCDALIVIEAKQRSGSLISARWALEQGKEVFAVPGGVGQGASSGCHELIREGAYFFETVADLFAVLPQLLPRDASKTTKAPMPSDNLSPLHETICGLLSSGPLFAETLFEALDVSMQALMAALHQLESDGKIHRRQGAYYLQ
jgi:DNA processing protein